MMESRSSSSAVIFGKFSRIKEYEADKYAPVFDEDYEYYAHFALLKTDGGKIKAICSWGGFYDYYASQSREEREIFHADLESKKYPRLLYLLTQSEYKFEKVNGIGGFSIETDIDYTDDMEELGRRAMNSSPFILTLHSTHGCSRGNVAGSTYVGLATVAPALCPAP